MTDIARIELPVQSATVLAYVQLTPAQFSSFSDLLKELNLGTLARRKLIYVAGTLPGIDDFDLLSLSISVNPFGGKTTGLRMVQLAASQVRYSFKLDTIQRSFDSGGTAALIRILEFTAQELPNIPIVCSVLWEHSLEKVDLAIALPFTMPVPELGEMTIVQGVKLTDATGKRSVTIDNESKGKTVKLTARFEAGVAFDKNLIQNVVKFGETVIQGIVRPIGVRK